MRHAAPASRLQLVRPNLKPRKKLLWVLLVLFAAWVGLLAWVYVTQIVMKH